MPPFSLLFVAAVLFTLFVAELLQHANLLVRLNQRSVTLLRLLFRVAPLLVKEVNFAPQRQLASVAALQMCNVQTTRQERTAQLGAKVLEVSLETTEFRLQGE